MVDAVEQIRSILAANLQARFLHLKLDHDSGALTYASPVEQTKPDVLGFLKGDRLLIAPSAWRSELCAGFDPEKTARHLRAEGLLHADPGKLQKQEKVLRGASVEKGRFYVLDLRILEDAVGSGPKERT